MKDQRRNCVFGVSVWRTLICGCCIESQLTNWRYRHLYTVCLYVWHKISASNPIPNPNSESNEIEIEIGNEYYVVVFPKIHSHRIRLIRVSVCACVCIWVWVSKAYAKSTFGTKWEFKTVEKYKANISINWESAITWTSTGFWKTNDICACCDDWIGSGVVLKR